MSEIDLEQFREAVKCWYDAALPANDVEAERKAEAKRLLSIIDNAGKVGVKFNAAFFVNSAGNRIEQLTTYEDYRRDGAVLALMDLGQKRASAKKLTKKDGGRVVLAWVSASQPILEDDDSFFAHQPAPVVDDVMGSLARATLARAQDRTLIEMTKRAVDATAHPRDTSMSHADYVMEVIRAAVGVSNRE